MSIFGNLFGGKAPTRPAANLGGFKSAAEFLGAILLWQFFPGDRVLCAEESLTKGAQNVPLQHRQLVGLWENIFVTWLLRVHVKQKFGEELSRDMMAAVYGRIGTNEDRAPGMKAVADGLKFWFGQLDDALQHAMANPQQINGQNVPFVYPAAWNFVMLDDASPYAKSKTGEFDGFDIQVAQALAEVQDASKARIDHVIVSAEGLPR